MNLFNGVLADNVHDEALMAQFHAQVEPIAALFESGDTAKAMREVTALADAANQYIAKHEPWNMAKDPEHQMQCSSCAVGHQHVSLPGDLFETRTAGDGRKSRAFTGRRALMGRRRSHAGYTISSNPCCGALKPRRSKKWWTHPSSLSPPQQQSQPAATNEAAG